MSLFMFRLAQQSALGIMKPIVGSTAQAATPATPARVPKFSRC